jgi:hypothetical protein
MMGVVAPQEVKARTPKMVNGVDGVTKHATTFA